MCDSVKSALVHSNKFKKEFKKYKNIYKGLYYSCENDSWSNWMPRNNEPYLTFLGSSTYGAMNASAIGTHTIGEEEDELWEQ